MTPFVTTIAQSPPPPQLPPVSPGLGDFAAISLIVAAIGTVAKQAWEYFVQKDKQESGLTDTLINDLRNNQAKIISDVTQGMDRLAAAYKETALESRADFRSAIEELRKGEAGLQGAVVHLGQTIGQDVQANLKTQTLLYESHRSAMEELKFNLRALHERADRWEVVLKQLCEGNCNYPADRPNRNSSDFPG
ncbi:hypothetical protein BST81_13770 [Leptolyngbya sp. 'hensonii']|uniref:hypothetical protein n=1 Tax=Leptolyngbya sp. 'hensonii' TaxID=1922337 RepID=UPI00094F9C43|nr:hypothetical protein [Leptolyngbya sp. 'hensonii']OLP18088.1 hypothetical protein BST81_13770 [Leptolyngbya sp. 'hensonii']